MYYALIAPYIFEACLLVERISLHDLSDVRVPKWPISAISVSFTYTPAPTMAPSG